MTDYTGLPDALIQKLISKSPKGIGQFPPPVFDITPSEFIEHIEGKSMTLRFPILEKYNNPMGITFGGVFGMFFDMAMGPFSGLEGHGPTTSLDLNITYIKALRVKDEYVDVTAEIISNTKSFLILHGKAITAKGQLVATASSRMMVLNIERMS